MLSPFNEDQFSKAKTYIDSLGYIIKGNSAALTNNKPLSQETQRNFDDSLLNAVSKLNLNCNSYVARPTEYSDASLLLVGLYTGYQLKCLEIENLQNQISLQQEQYNQLKQNYDSLNDRYNEVVENVKKITANSPDPEEFACLKQKLEDSEKRLKLQAQTQEEENKQNIQNINAIKQRNLELEREIEDLQATEMKSKRTNTSECEKIAKAFGLDAQTADDIIQGIKDKFNVDDTEENIADVLQNRSNEQTNKYEKLLQSFGVRCDSKTPQTDITMNVQKNFSGEIMKTLQRNYGSIAQGRNIPIVVDNIVQNKSDILKKIIAAFNLPPAIDHNDIIDALRQKLNYYTQQSYESSFMNAPPPRTSVEVSNSPSQRASVKAQSTNNDEQVELQQRQIDELQAKLQELEETNNELEEKQRETENQVQDKAKKVSELRSKNSELSKNVDALVDEVHDLKTENEELKKKMSQKTQNFQSKIDQLSEMVNNLADKLQSTKKENHNLKHTQDASKKKLSQLEKSLKNERNAYSQLESQMQSQLSLITEENEQLKQDLEQTKIQNSALSNLQVDAPEQSPSQKMQQVVDEIMKRFQEQCDELRDESQLRLQLIAIIRKQSSLITEYDRLLKEQAENTVPKKEEARETILSPTRKPTDLDDNAFLSVIDDLEVAGDAEDVLADVQHLGHEEGLTTRARFVNVINYLFDTYSKSRREMKENEEKMREEVDDCQQSFERLLKQIQVQTRFIEQVARSNIDIEAPLRNQILESVARTQNFLLEYGAGFTEDRSLYDMTNINADPLKLREKVEDVFNQYDDIDSNIGKELLALFAQSVSVSSVLRRYGSEAQTQIQRLSGEVKRLRTELDATRTDMENRVHAIQQECEETVKELSEKAKSGEEIIDSVKNILRANITNEELITPIFKALERLLDGDVIYDLDPQEYNDALAQTLNKTKEDAEQSKQQMEQFRQAISKVSNDVENASGMLEKETNELIDQQNDQITILNEEVLKLRQQTEDLAEEINKKEEENKELTRRNDELAEVLQKSEQRVSQLETEMKTAEKTVRNKYKQNLDKTLTAILQDHKSRMDQLQRRIKNVQKDNAKAIAQKDRELQETQQQCDQRCNELLMQKEMAERELKASEEEAQTMLLNLRTQLKEAQNAQISLDLENKVLQQRMKSLEERTQREKDNYEAQYSLKQIKNDDDLRAKSQRLQEEMEKKKNEFMTKLVAELREFADSTVPVTEQNVLALMSDIYTRLKINARDNEKADDLDRQMREIRQLLDAPKGTRTVAVVRDYTESFRELKAKISTLEKEKKNVIAELSPDEWNEWAKRVSKVVFDGKQPESSRELRQKIEEAVFAAVNSQNILHKLEFLREQKKVLQEQAIPPEKDDFPTSLTSVICSFMFLRRIMRMSNHIPTEIAVKEPLALKQERERSQQTTQEDAQENSLTNTTATVTAPPKVRTSSISQVFARSITVF